MNLSLQFQQNNYDEELKKIHLFPLLGVLLVFAWQWATVRANYSGNWTALFCTGSVRPLPPLAQTENLFIFKNSTGYDGQVYHYVAHDPLMRTGLKAFVDDPRLRYRRILVPALAYAIALGRSEWIDPAIEIVFLLTVALGFYWSCRIAEAQGLAPAWGFLMLLIPAIPVTMDRLVVDGALAVFTAGFIYYRDNQPWKLFVVLVCAALTRETGFLLIAAAFLFQFFRRDYKLTAIVASAAVPALAWYAYVQTLTSAKPYAFSLVPLSAIAQVLVNPWQYPSGTPLTGLIVVADYAAFIGILVALVLALVRKPAGPIQIAALLFAMLAVVVQRPDHWQHVYDFGRLQSPLLVCLAGLAALERKPWALVPMLMLLPRLAIQFAPQALGVIHWL